MRIYIKKHNSGFIIYKESLKDSIISDTISLLVIVTAFALNFAFSFTFGSSWIINTMFVLFILIYFLGSYGCKERITTKEQFQQELQSVADDLNV